jgi:ribonuclease P protein component
VGFEHLGDAVVIARDLRLRSPRDFERARSEGRSWSNALLVAVVRPNGMPANRYGFAVGRRVGTAVARNRAKRLMREAARGLHPHLRPGHDVLFIARNRFDAQTSYGDVFEAARDLMERSGLVASEAKNAGS